MTAAHDIRGAVEDLRRWEECGAEELLASPWRAALGVWPVKDGITTFPLSWRWTLAYLPGAKPASLYVTNDARVWHQADTIQDRELAHILEAGELLRLNGRGLLEVIKRRGRGGHITWQMASGTEGRDEADACGRRVTLKAALGQVGMLLRKVEVRP